jgi:hypothetical protein
MRPVDVPAMRSKWSTIRKPVSFPQAANADAVNVPAMPPPSRERMRKDPPCDSCPEGLD